MTLARASRQRRLLVITVCNLKGGTAKTTSSVFLSYALSLRGFRVLLVDADPTRSSLSWSEQAAFPFSVIGLAVKNLHSQRAGIVSDDIDIVVIDAPPLEEQRGIVQSAMRAADAMVITMAPTTIEFDRLDPVFAALEDTAGLRDGGLPSAFVLLNRCVSQASSTETFRSIITEQGRRVLANHIPRKEIYAQAFPDDVKDPADYKSVAAELLAALDMPECREPVSV